MKKILIILVALLILPFASEARIWDSGGEERSLCVEGHGTYKFRGEGEALIENIIGGSARFPLDAEVTVLDGEFDILYKRNYMEYSGHGDLKVEEFDGSIVSKGRGTGDLKVRGIGRLYIGNGRKDYLEIDCNW